MLRARCCVSPCAPGVLVTLLVGHVPRGTIRFYVYLCSHIDAFSGAVALRQFYY